MMETPQPSFHTPSAGAMGTSAPAGDFVPGPYVHPTSSGGTTHVPGTASRMPPASPVASDGTPVASRSVAAVPPQHGINGLQQKVKELVNDEWAASQMDTIKECLKNPQKARELGIIITVQLAGENRVVSVAPPEAGLSAQELKKYSDTANTCIGKLEKSLGGGTPAAPNYTAQLAAMKLEYERLATSEGFTSDWDKFLEAVKRHNGRHFRKDIEGCVITITQKQPAAGPGSAPASVDDSAVPSEDETTLPTPSVTSPSTTVPTEPTTSTSFPKRHRHRSAAAVATTASSGLSGDEADNETSEEETT